MVLSGNVHTNDTSDTFCIDHTNGIVGIGQSLTNLVNDSNVLQISGGVHATRYYGDGSHITGLTDSKWIEDENDINNIYYSAGNVGIGGAASSTNELKVHGTVEATSFSGIQASDVPNLSASKITTGTLDIDRIPTLGTDKISGDFGAGGNVGINTTTPHRALDVQAPARPSTYPFAIGGSWSNRAEYVAKTYDPGNGGTGPPVNVDFVLGGGGKPGWARVVSGAWKPTNLPYYYGSMESACIAEFTFGIEGTHIHSVREYGDGNINIVSSGSHNGGRIQINQTSSLQSTWRVWYEIYHEDGVYW